MLIKHTYQHRGEWITEMFFAIPIHRVIQCLHDILTIAIIGVLFVALFWGFILTEVSL